MGRYGRTSIWHERKRQRDGKGRRDRRDGSYGRDGSPTVRLRVGDAVTRGPKLPPVRDFLLWLDDHLGVNWTKNLHGEDIPRHLRTAARHAEARGMVTYDGVKGWELTEYGIDSIKQVMP